MQNEIYVSTALAQSYIFVFNVNTWENQIPTAEKPN